VLRLGEHVQIRVLRGGEDGRALDREQVAAYVAKYSCKGSREQITRCGAGPDQLRDNGVPEQLVQMAAAALGIAARRGLGRVGEWVHMLGVRGHFVTKSRGYSTILGPCATPVAGGAPTAMSSSSTTTSQHQFWRRGSTSGPGTSTPATCSWRPAWRPRCASPAKPCSTCAADHPATTT